MKNMHEADRIIRLLLGVVFCLLGYFWIAPSWSWLAFAAGIVMFGTALLGYCPIYQLLGFRSATNVKPVGAWGLGVAAVALVTLVGVGSYGSAFLTRKSFLEDFNAMNHFYKQTLFLTGKEQRPETVANLDKLKPAFAKFTAKYSVYRPYDLKGDAALYPEISDKLKVIETEANDDEIKAIRTALDDVLATAGASLLDVLPTKGEALKSSFVKVYLKRG